MWSEKERRERKIQNQRQRKRDGERQRERERERERKGENAGGKRGSYCLRTFMRQTVSVGVSDIPANGSELRRRGKKLSWEKTVQLNGRHFTRNALD